MRRGPTWIDFRHPIVDLSHGVVWIAGAGPVAQRHRRRDAGLTGINDPTILRREPAQVEKVYLETFVPEMTFSAIFARRKVFDISPGQVWSLRVEPLIRRIRELDLALF